MRINEEFVFEDKNGKVYEYTLRNDKIEFRRYYYRDICSR